MPLQAGNAAAAAVLGRADAALAWHRATGQGLPWGRPRREVLLLALVAVAALSPSFALNSQDVSRLCLTNALRDGRVSNDPCLGTTFAVDRASYGGHFYSDKAPGMSVLQVPSAVAVDLPKDIYRWPLEGWQIWAIRVLSSGIALLVAAFLVGRICEGLAPGCGGMSLVTFALGTLVAPFGAANFGHVTAGTLGLAAFALAWSRRPLPAGLAAGAAVCVEYQSALIAVVLVGYAALHGLRHLRAFALGVLPGAALLALYDWAAFGAPWRLSYRYVAEEFQAEQSGGFFGIHLPNGHAVREVFVGDGGLLLVSPVVAAAAYGLVLLGRRHRAEALACGLVVLAFVALNCGYYYPYGGRSPGPRFLLPALPFLALGLGPAFAARFRLTAVLAALSLVPMTALTLTWANGAPAGSIWGALEDLVRARGDSWLAQTLTSNVFDQVDWLSRRHAAELVALAAFAAFAVALATAATSSRPTWLPRGSARARRLLRRASPGSPT